MLKKLTSKWWFWWIIAGIAIRVLVMPFTLHVDLWGHSFTEYFFAYEGQLNPYETLLSLPANHPIVRNFGVSDIFIYPPLTYYTLGIYRVLIKPFVDPGFLPFVMEYPSRVFERPDLYWNLFLFKLPYLFLDIGIGFLLAGMFDNVSKKRRAFILWMLNPVTLYATFMIGQIDILPTFFAVLALYFAYKKKNLYSIVALGVGSAYKLWPIFLIIPAALIFEKDFWKRAKLAVAGFAPLLISVLPFVNSSAFRYMVFSPKSQKMLFMNFPVSGAEGIFPFILILSLIYFILYFRPGEQRLSTWALAIVLLILSVTHYHPQWFLWVTPFLVWELAENNLKHWFLVLIFIGSWALITLFFEPSLSVGLFAPINPDLQKLPGLAEIVSKFFNVFQIKSYVRSVFAAAAIFYIWSIVNPQKGKMS